MLVICCVLDTYTIRSLHIVRASDTRPAPRKLRLRSPPRHAVSGLPWAETTSNTLLSDQKGRLARRMPWPVASGVRCRAPAVEMTYRGEYLRGGELWAETESS